MASGHRPRSPDRRRRAAAGDRASPGEASRDELEESVGAVADRVLVRRQHLPEGGGPAGREADRVVAEAVARLRGPDRAAVLPPPPRFALTVRPGVRPVTPAIAAPARPVAHWRS